MPVFLVLGFVLQLVGTALNDSLRRQEFLEYHKVSVRERPISCKARGGR